MATFSRVGANGWTQVDDTSASSRVGANGWTQVNAGTTNVSVTTGLGALSITGYVPTVVAPISVSTGVGALSITGLAPTVTTQQSVTTGLGALTITGYEPGVSLVSSVSVTTDVGALTLAGLAPTITQQQAVTTGLGAVTLTGLAPAITVQEAVTTGLGALTITGVEPTVDVIDYDYLNAASDVTDGSWVRSDNGTNTNLFEMLDEATFDDADYITTTTLNDECEIGLEAGQTPSVAGYLTLQIRVPAGFTPVGTLSVTLREGASTTVQSWADQSVTAGSMLNLAVTETISDYSDLRVRLKATA